MIPFSHSLPFFFSRSFTTSYCEGFSFNEISQSVFTMFGVGVGFMQARGPRAYTVRDIHDSIIR